jgi:hypothetical protein
MRAWWAVALVAGCFDPSQQAEQDQAKVAAQMDDLEARSAAIRDAGICRTPTPARVSSLRPSLPCPRARRASSSK